jgi:hypothetical protein
MSMLMSSAEPANRARTPQERNWTMPARPMHSGSSTLGRSARACLGWLLAISLLATSGCGAVRHDLPIESDVAKTAALPIDGVWLNTTFNKHFQFERGRIWLMDPWVVGPVRIDPGQVTGVELRQTGPRHFKARDIGSPGDPPDYLERIARLRARIVLAAAQAPELADIRKAGHERGDFLFIRETPSGSQPK